MHYLSFILQPPHASRAFAMRPVLQKKHFCPGSIAAILVFAFATPAVFAQNKNVPPPDSLAIQDQVQGYLDSGDARKALATLAGAARKDPSDRVIGALLYGTVRNYAWHPPQLLPLRHKGPVKALAFSPDGSMIASGSEYGEVVVFPSQALDKNDGAAHQKWFRIPDEIIGLAFSRDGHRVVIASRAGWTRLWDFAADKVVFTAPRPDVCTTAFASAKNEDVAAVGMENGTVQVLNLTSGKLIYEQKQSGGKVKALALSREGDKLAAVNADGKVRVWNLRMEREIGKGLVPGGVVNVVDFSRDGRYVATAGMDGKLKLFDPESGKQALPAMDCETVIEKISVSIDGSMIATMLNDQSILFWDAVTGKKIDFNLRADAPFNAMQWSRSALRMATASANGTASLWTLYDGARFGEAMPHDGPVVTVAFSPDSNLLASGGVDGMARVWRTDDGLPMPTVRAHTSRARTAFYSADGHDLVTTSEDNTALHWISGQVQPFGPALKHKGNVTCAVFNKDATLILSSDDSGVAQLWDAKTGREKGKPYQHETAVNWVDFHPDGERFVSIAGPGAYIWSASDSSKPLAVIRHPGEGKSELKCARFSPDGKWLVTASTDGSARVWDATTYKPTEYVIERNSPVLCVRFSPDGTRLVATSEDSQAIVYDTATWQQVGSPIIAPGPVFSAFITEDNRFIAISSFLLNAVQFFKIDTGSPLGLGVPIPTQATCIDYMLQDKVVVIACDDGTVRALGTPFVTQDVPPWMCDLAERFAGYKATGNDTFERVDSSFAQMLAYLTPAVQTGNEDFSRLARWRLTMGPQRPGMPRFTSTLADNIERRVDERSVDALFECFDAVPGDPLVVAALSLYWPNRQHGEYLADLVLAIPNSPPLARAYAAGALINAGRSREAVSVMNQALADAPNDPRVLRRAAKFNARLEKKDVATELFEKALSIEPNNYETHRAYAWALYNMGEPAKATTQFHLAQDICGDMNPDIIAGLCLCADTLKNQTEARAAYGRLVALDSSWKEASYIASLRGWTGRETQQLEQVRSGIFKKK